MNTDYQSKDVPKYETDEQIHERQWSRMRWLFRFVALAVILSLVLYTNEDYFEMG